MTTETTVFVVDDNAGVRKGLTALLESAGIAVETYATAEEFLAAFTPARRGCLILDVRLRDSNGLDVQDELRRRRASLPVIVLTGHGNVPTSVRALKAGAVDFLQKPMPPEPMLERVRAALEKDREAHSAFEQQHAVLEQLAALTPREREVMDLLLTGHSSKEIASAMQISVRTVEGHRRMVFAKLDVSSAAQLVRVVLSATGPGTQGGGADPSLVASRTTARHREPTPSG
jgi:FixJ family two-component response regulator